MVTEGDGQSSNDSNPHRLRRIIARHTGRPLDEVERDVGRDRWFDAEEARDYGFVDHVVGSLDDVRPMIAARRIGLRP